jgi:translation initiation factor IF-2
LEPEYKEVVIGQAQVRELFKVSGLGTIAGSYVTDGKVSRNAKARLVRNGIVIYDGAISSVRRFKDDVKEVNRGYECGIMLENFNDIKEEDIIEIYEMQEIER